MKMPNGYGSVVKLKGTRRQPWAVRISYLEEQPDGKVKRKRKYLEYFSDQKSAISYLAEYNNGLVVKEHEKFVDNPTFAELYEKWKKYRKGLKSNPVDSTWKNYDIAFGFFAPLHDKKVVSIRFQELQDCVSAKSSKSKTTIGSMRAILRGMWQYGINNEYLSTDITQTLVFEYTDSDTPVHTTFTEKELTLLWNSLYVVNNVDIILIYIYTGLRPVELLDIESCNVHLDEKYMIGGVKTDAGKNRIIPIHDAILPLVEKRLADNRKYLITNKFGNHYTRAVYHNSNWNTAMLNLGLNHAPHDCRYTFAYLADKAEMNETCKKIILGHSLANKSGTAFKTGSTSDVTHGTYTEKTLQDLLDAVNMLPTVFS